MIYLDNAATTFPKPREVCDEVYRCMLEYCGNPGRGSHSLSLKSAEKVFECRSKIANFFGSEHPEHVVFTQNATYALNLAIKAFARRGDHILISNIEHNSVFRPVYALKKRGVYYGIFDASPEGGQDAVIDSIRRRLRPNTRMIIAAHASNICGITLPIREIGALCRERGIIFIVDASQSAGRMAIDIERDNVGVLCAPGHKGLYGPQGSGFALFSEDTAKCAPSLITLAEGGSGVRSLEKLMPSELPEHFEAGTLSVPAIAGLCRGVKMVSDIGLDAISAHEGSLSRALTEALASIDGVTLYRPELACGSSIVSFNLNGIDSASAAGALNEAGYCVRGGFHCSPLAHELLQTGKGGAIRASFGIFNSQSDVESFARTVEQLMSERSAELH